MQNCFSKSTKKVGKRKGVQRYQCNDCKRKFQSTRRPNKLQKIIFYEYLYKKQSLSDLAIKYKKSSKWIQTQIKEYQPTFKTHNPRPVSLVCDATFYGKRKDKLGTLVFLDYLTKEVLIWKHIEAEKKDDYQQLLKQLLDLGYTILSATTDGWRGLDKVFEEYPFQRCQFHQIRTVQRYITLNPRLKAGKDLKAIISRLTSTTQSRFTKKLDTWNEKYKDFIEEKTINPKTGKSFYTHYKVRSAYRSLRTNLPYLFTYKNQKNLQLPNTTNNLEGGVFSPMMQSRRYEDKKKINMHSGMSKSLKLKMVDDYLVNNKKK